MRARISVYWIDIHICWVIGIYIIEISEKIIITIQFGEPIQRYTKVDKLENRNYNEN